MVPDDGVDDELVDAEVGGHGFEAGADARRGSDEVAGPVAFLGGGSAEGAEFAKGFFGRGHGAAVVHADAALEEADAGGEVFGFGVGVGADDADGGDGLGVSAAG